MCIMVCGFSGVTAHTIFMLCIMQNFRCIILSAIASAAANTVHICISQNSDSFIKFINESHAVINIGKIDNDAQLSDFKIYSLSLIIEIFVMRSNNPGHHVKACPFFIIYSFS